MPFRTKMYILTALLFLFIVNNAVSQKIKAIEPINWSEDLKDVRPVSGSFEIGLMSNEDKNAKSFMPEYFSVMLPETKYKYLCVKIVSYDSRYVADLQYQIDTIKKPTQVTFHLPTQHSSKLKSYKYDQLVIMSCVTNDCKNKKDFSYVLSTWNPTIDSKLCNVFLNSGLPSSVLIFKNNKKVYEMFCETVYPNGVAYSKKCSIPLNMLDASATVLIRIKEGGTPIDIPIPITIK